jgi:NAD(P)-dependent dehydrogenase (short-subunit alcohol dehydrogenase family)
MFQDEVVLVTGAASGIGKACVQAFAAQGAFVVGLDISPAVVSVLDKKYLGIICDLAEEAQMISAINQLKQQFHSLEMLILNAGIFPPSRNIADMPLDEWQKTLRINLNANLVLLRETHPLLKQAKKGGRVVVNASKNVPAPGPGAAAYSASKAALTQLARVAALEWGSDNIRVNILHPNAVFDTGLWTDEVIAKRAASYGLSIEDYKTNNVLKVEVTSQDVANMAVMLCSPAFSKTTGAQIAVDGGNDRVI